MCLLTPTQGSVSTLGKTSIWDLNFDIYCFCCWVTLSLPNTLLAIQVGSKINKHSPYSSISKSLRNKTN